jgi:hypothetical protein
MNVAVQGTKEFSDYNIFLRAMGVALSGLPEADKYFNIYSVGPTQINSFTAEFSNRSENGLRQRGVKVRFYRVPVLFIEENVSYFNYFVFLCNADQKPSKLTALMELNNIETGIFRY